MKRTLLITTDFPPMVGGLAKWYERIYATALPGDVFVLAPHVPGDARLDFRQPYRIVRGYVPTSSHLIARLIQIVGLFAQSIAIVRREKIDIVHIGQLHLGLIGFMLKFLLGVPYVVFLHGGEMAPYIRFGAIRAVVRTIVSSALIVVVNSTYTRHHFESMGIRNPRTEILTMSVPIECFRPGLDIRKIHTRYGLGGQKIILTVGRLVERKGHDLVLRSLNQIKRAVGPVRYLIAGCGPEEQRLRTLAVDLNCSEEVVFAGHVSEGDLPFLYAACDVFVMPSRALPKRDGIEGFGIVFLEAGACGKPVIGGRSGGTVDAVLDGVTGLLVDPLDTQDLADTLIRLLVDRQEAARLGTGGRLRAERLALAWRASLERIWSD